MKVSPKTVTLFLTSAALVVIIFGIAAGGLYESFSQRVNLAPTKSQPSQQPPLDETEKKVVVNDNQQVTSFQQTDTLPDTFPSDFPIYTGATMEGYWEASQSGTTGISVVWRSPDSLDTVSEFLASQLLANGWKITTDYSDAESATYTFSKDATEGFIGITNEEGETLISVTVGTKR